MENYIKTHEKENILNEFYQLCGKDETGKKLELQEAECYGKIKKWFLNQYPVFREYTENIDKILNKKIA